MEEKRPGQKLVQLSRQWRKLRPKVRVVVGMELQVVSCLERVWPGLGYGLA